VETLDGPSRESKERHDRAIVPYFFCIGLAARVATEETGNQHRMKLSNEANGAERPVTTAQLADHLQVTTRTLAAYRAQKRIPFWRINSRNIRYRLSDVERALVK